MRHRLLAPLAGLLLLAACAATGRPAAGACGDPRPICLAGTDCTVDRSSGCEVCVCRAADANLSEPAGPAHARPEGQREVLPPLR